MVINCLDNLICYTKKNLNPQMVLSDQPFFLNFVVIVEMLQI